MFKKIIYLFLLVFFVTSCGGTFDNVKRGLTGEKKQSSDEFFVKKNVFENSKYFQKEKKTILNKEEYTKKTNDLRKKVIDFNSDRKAAIDKITIQRSEYRKTLLKKLDPILNSYIKENNISLVLDKKDMLGGNPEFDITQLIIEKLNTCLMWDFIED